MKRLLKLFVAFAGLLTVLFVVGYYYAVHQVEGSFFENDGVKIHYTDEGVGIPVVLLHGFAANSDLNWRRPGICQRLLGEGFRVITMDLRGHGKSDKPHDVSKYGEKMAQDVAKLLEYTGIEKAHLVGYSLGGFIALKCAVLYPDRWITLTAMASGWDDPQNSNSFGALEKALNDYESGKPVGPLINYFDETGEMKTGFLHTQWFKILTTYFNDREAIMAIIRSARRLGISKEELASIQIPVCGIAGDEDPILNKAKALAGAPNNKVIFINGANHITTMTSRKAKDALVNFLKENS